MPPHVTMHPWERLTGEPIDLYSWFLRWLMQREQWHRLARATRASEEEIAEARRRWAWERRAAAYDVHIAMLALPAAAERMAHHAAAQLSAAKASSASMAAWAKRAAWLAGQEPQHTDWHEIVRMARLAQAERTAPVVEAGQTSAEGDVEDLSMLSTDDLLALRRGREIEARLAKKNP